MNDEKNGRAEAKVEAEPSQTPQAQPEPQPAMPVAPVTFENAAQTDVRMLTAQLQPLIVFLFAVLSPQAVLHFAKMILNTVATSQLDAKDAPLEVVRWFEDQSHRCKSALTILDSIISVVPAGARAQVVSVGQPPHGPGRRSR